MRRASVLTAAAAVLTLAACSSSLDKSAAAPPTTASSSTSQPTATCNLKSQGDIIERVVVPGQPATAQQLGSVDLAQCKMSFDTLAQETSTDAGYCSTEAWLADNPGYPVDAVPAPPLKKIQAQAGAAC